MEANKDIIITLIQADLLHHQLIGNLRKIEFHTDRYALELHKAISQLMGLGDQVYEQWYDIYDEFLLNAHLLPVSESNDHLFSVAQECYHLLASCIKIKTCLNRSN